MRILSVLASAIVLAATFVGGTSASAQQSCGSHRAGCVAACTPGLVAHVYAGSYRRCTASCEPRWNECLRTGIWVDLERRSSGGAELAPPF